MARQNKLLVSILMFASLMFAEASFASFTPSFNFKGKLVRYDDKYFWLAVASGGSTVKAKFSRKYFPSVKGYVVGVAEVNIDVAANEFYDLNPEFK